MQSNVKVSTKPDADSDAKETALTIEYPDGIPAWCMNGYTAYLVVKLQGSWRKKGIPPKVTVKAIDHAPGSRAPSMTAEETVMALNPEDFKRITARYEAMHKKAA